MRAFYLIRHGETDWNRKFRRLQGHIDIPLNDVGIQQAKSLAPLLQPFQISRFISSDLSRAFDTARLISSPSLPLEITKDLREIQLGDAEGKTLNEVDEIYGPEFRKNWSSFDYQHQDLRFPQGESRREALDRTQACLHYFLDLYPTETLAFVAHGYLIRSLVYAKSNIQSAFLVPNCAVIPFCRTPDRELIYQGPQDPQDLIQPPAQTVYEDKPEGGSN